MADVLVVGAGLAAGLYLLWADPKKQDGVQGEASKQFDTYLEGCWKPNANPVGMGSANAERAMACEVPEGTFRSGPSEGLSFGGSRRKRGVPDEFLAGGLDDLQQRNVINSMVESDQLFNPHRFARYRYSGTASPGQAAFMTRSARLVPWSTSMDYSPYVVRDFEPINEGARDPFDYGPFVQRPELAAQQVYLEQEHRSITFPPNRPGVVGPKSVMFPSGRSSGKMVRMTQERLAGRV